MAAQSVFDWMQDIKPRPHKNNPPWFHCAGCLHRLGFGRNRMARIFRRDPATIKEWQQEFAAHIPKPSPIAFFRRRVRKPASVKNPISQCAKCLFSIGLGRHKIGRFIFGRSKKSHTAANCVVRWLKKHRPNRLFIIKKLHPPAKRYQLKIPIEQRAYFKKQHRLKVYLRRKVWGFFKHGLHPKSTARLIACSLKDFRHHILSKTKGTTMSFDNYGKVWELDHIIPCKLFDLFIESERLACFHYTNLQPMLAHDNRVKHASGSRQLTLL